MTADDLPHQVSGAERWALWEEGELPDARLYLHQVHAMADTLDLT
jgi:hypothetical protein